MTTKRKRDLWLVRADSHGACMFFACLAYPHSWEKRDHYIRALFDFMARAHMARHGLKRAPKGLTLHMQRQQQDRAMANGLERIKDRERAWHVAKWCASPRDDKIKLGPFDAGLYIDQNLAWLRGKDAKATGRRMTRSIKSASLAQAIATVYGSDRTVRFTLRLPTASIPGALLVSPTGPQATTAQVKNFIRKVWSPSKPVLHMIAAIRPLLNQKPIFDLIMHPDDWLHDTLTKAETYRRILPNAQHLDGSIVWPTIGEMIQLHTRRVEPLRF